MNLNQAQLVMGAGAGEGVMNLPLDPALAWTLYLVVLAVNCAALWFLQRFAEPTPPNFRRRRTPRPHQPDLDEAA